MDARVTYAAPVVFGLALALGACQSDKSVSGVVDTTAAFSVGGTITGSSGTVALSCNGHTMSVSGSGPFACPDALGVGAAYEITVLSAPTAQTCNVTAGTGTVSNANITSVAVACEQTSFVVTLSVSGLIGDANLSVTLGGVTQVVTANGDVPMTLLGTPGEPVAVTLPAQPAGHRCQVNLGTFNFSATPVTVAVACVRDMRITSSSAAAMVLGQTDFVTGTLAGAPVPLGKLDAPAGRVAGAANGFVFVAEYSGNQVSALIPGADASGAFRLGVDVTQTPAAQYGGEDLAGPTAVAVSDTQLAVASNAGSRVLLYNSIPSTTVAADVVVGQAGFGSAPVLSCSANNIVAPTDVAFADGKLFISDSGCNRVLVFDPVPTASNAGAVLVLGQDDFTSYHPNRNLNSPGPASLNRPGAVWANANMLFVADSYNNRVLVWSTMPTVVNQQADRVLGQASFFVATSGSGADALSLPSGLVADDYGLYVADTANNRVLVYTLPLSGATPQATGVLGQADFVGNSRNAPSSQVAAQNFYQPTGLGFFDATLMVNDGQDYRVLGFASR